jgi:SAM-dependent methyltransferase
MKRKKAPSPDLETIFPILIGIWRRFRKISGPPDILQTREFRSVVASVKCLQEMSKDGVSLVGKDYFQDPELLGAYCLYQWQIRYQEGLSLIGELPSPPKRVLDVCSGAAPFAFAALRHGAQDVYAADQSLQALQRGAEIAGRYGMPMTIRRWDCKKPLAVEGKFDLIIAAHCLAELFPETAVNWQEKQQRFVEMLLSKLTPDGHLLLVDSSYNDANKRLLSLRDSLVQKGVPVQAPCVWKGDCPALKTANSPCFAQRELEKTYFIKEVQRAAEINLSSLKMSYIIFRHPSAGWPQLSTKGLYRVISPAVDSYQGKRYYLCGTEGKKTLGTRLEEHPPESRAFDYLKRGELLSFEGALETSHGIDVIPGTKVNIEAARGKPLPDGLEDF